MSGVPVREQWKLGKAHINPVPRSLRFDLPQLNSSVQKRRKVGDLTSDLSDPPDWQGPLSLCMPRASMQRASLKDRDNLGT
jgi:hypothetical protein